MNTYTAQQRCQSERENKIQRQSTKLQFKGLPQRMAEYLSSMFYVSLVLICNIISTAKLNFIKQN